MKKNDDKNKKFINETLAKSKTLTKSANIFLQQNNLSNTKNPNYSKDNENPNQKKLYSTKEEREAIKEELNEEELENEEENTDDEDNSGINTMEYVTKNIERYQKYIKRYDDQVRKNLQLSKQHPEKKDEYKTEAIRALKKKKFYSKALERYEDKKLKLEMKALDNEYKMQKKEYKKLMRKLKKKVRMLTLGEEYDEDDNDDSDNSEEENDAIFNQIDLDDKTLEAQYEQIINKPEIKDASENLNLFKFIFQEE